jgi:hypothetical protein
MSKVLSAVEYLKQANLLEQTDKYSDRYNTSIQSETNTESSRSDQSFQARVNDLKDAKREYVDRSEN